MKRRAFIRLLVTATVLAGVGQAAHAAQVSAHPIRVACIGDSITFGLGIVDASARYPAQLQALLGSAYEVRNFGHSGCTVTRDTFSQWPRGYVRQTEFSDALAFQPEIVICNLGINDASGFADGQRAFFVRDYLEIIRAFQALPTKPRLILWQPLAPLFPGHAYFDQPVVRELNQLLRQVAELSGAETLDVHTSLASHVEWFPDHIHPNAAGARQIAETTAQFLCAKPGSR